jgi:predicted nucleotidyltransferase component of viral defense system
MITEQQLKKLTKMHKINEYVVLREYLQLLFLKELYAENFSKKIYFKGGTSIRLIYGGKRFSEDLDFTVCEEEEVFVGSIDKLFNKLENIYPLKFKKRKTLTGKTFLMTAELNVVKNPVFIKLDFSMRENVIMPEEKIIRTDYPIVMQNFIYCLSLDELLAEKIRAVLKRNKHRDLYDLWILLEFGARVDLKLINKKLNYYQETFDKDKLLIELNKFTEEEFEKDLRPFLPINERDDLNNLFMYVKKYLVGIFS